MTVRSEPEVIDEPAPMQRRVAEERRAGRTVGLVPTMGALHEGHRSLIRLARQRADTVVVSIFVNPTQFGPDEDYEHYPRDFERDMAACAEEGTDLVFHPDPGTLYAPDHSTWVDETSVSAPLCGSGRPGHFRGVCTVVAKLFHICAPDLAVFGRKDAQQLRVIRRMVRDLNMPVEVIGAPIVREQDGLAMSSRNRYLDPSARRQARCLRRALDRAAEAVRQGQRDAEALKILMTGVIGEEPDAALEYAEIVDGETLESVDRIEGTVLAALAVRIAGTRLIDSEELTPDEEESPD
ncbi:pantoate--beta-alanine ligase [Kiritimatiella glycovorans]|uniref:Pantothenate synthetase n=1 Tax=Kiritimatiella glycovorans TaxID=1307763 RepID=A0A0G3EDK7_9BACT|nr:pantoate--beta-alanine ligase [Kiritimatiella glycovorans]AKJ64403.1 Pantothenate synthetase [Kiritimatiella glycovorans]